MKQKNEMENLIIDDLDPTSSDECYNKSDNGFDDEIGN